MNASLSTYQLLCIVPVLAALLFAFCKLLSRRHCRSAVDGHGSAVLITGCDSGFGYELARCLDHKGFVVFAGCLFPQGIGAQNLARESSSNLKILKLDVTNDADVQQAKGIVKENQGPRRAGAYPSYLRVRGYILNWCLQKLRSLSLCVFANCNLYLHLSFRRMASDGVAFQTKSVK